MIIPQYRIFYSWQSDNETAKTIFKAALKKVVEQFGKEGVTVLLEQGGGGCGFISIEDSVRIKIRRSDIFVGDVTPVGNVKRKTKLLPNANVMYEMGLATECLHASRILAVALKGDWKEEKMPFDFNHYTMLKFDEKNGINQLYNAIRRRIRETDKISRIKNERFFSPRLVYKNIKSGKYLPETFLENISAKNKVRCFASPKLMYPFLYRGMCSLNFDYYNKMQILKGGKGDFCLNTKSWSIEGKTVDIERLQNIIKGLYNYLAKTIKKLDHSGNYGWLASRKLERLNDNLDAMNKRLMMVTSDAGQGKTNFVCDLVRNVLSSNGIPYVFVNAYELSADQLAKSIAAEYNFIGDDSLEDVFYKAENYCNQHLQYLIIVIDGLNEHPKQGLFKSNLTRVLNAVREYRYVKVVMTCRKQYYYRNYQMLQKELENEIYEITLRADRFHDDRETTEDKCLLERYGKYFGTGVPTYYGVRRELLSNMLLLRIFFQAYEGQDVTGMTQVDYVDLYGRYFAQLCEQIQQIIEQDTHVDDVRGMSIKIFHHIIEWMVKTGTFRNLPFGSVLRYLPEDERHCFTAFMSANLILQQDSPEGDSGVSEVLNFTFEEIRDYLVSRYLVDEIYKNDKAVFANLVEKYTDGNNNLAEGTRRFLFLYSRISDNKEVYDYIKKLSWHTEILLEYIWDIPEEKITDADVAIVKEYLRHYPGYEAKIIAQLHWSPIKYPKLNLNVLLEVLAQMDEKKRLVYLEKTWPSTTNRRSVFGEPVATERGQLLSVLKDGIERRKDGPEEERVALTKLDQYLREGKDMGRLYVPILKKEEYDSKYVIYDYEAYCYLMKVHKGTKEEFMKKAGVSKGYALEMFSTLYDSIFAESKDVREMYENNYKSEYKDLKHFLMMHYSIPEKLVGKYVNACESDLYRLIDFDALSYGGDGVHGLVLSDDYMVRMYNWLNWDNDEN